MAEKKEKVDVVIVGSGWAGGITGAELAKKGYNVVCLERGSDQKTEDFVGSKDELRYSRRYQLMQDLTKETITSRNKLEDTAEPIRNNADLLVGTNTGGTSVHWNGNTFRWWPYDFEIYSKTVERYGKDKIPEGMTIQDWGITYDELEPYYDKYEKTIGISGEESPLGPKRSNPYPNPPMKESQLTKMFKKATEELGYHPYMTPSANMSQQYENPDGETINACMYCSFCEHFGCDFGAKADPIVTVLATARKTGNFVLRNESYVTRIIHDGTKATGLRYLDMKTGKEYEQPATIVVIAGFAFTNNRLLLLSEIGRPYDPVKKTGVIGKNMNGHDTYADVAGVNGFFNDKKFNKFAGAGSLASSIDDFSSDIFDHTDHDFLHGFEIQIVQSGDGPISNNKVPKGTRQWGKEFKKNSLYYANRNVYIFQQKGTLPFDHNYYDLDPTYKDAFGDPLLRVTRKYTDQDRKLSRFGVEKCTEIMEQMGADIIEPLDIPDEADFNHSYITGHFGGGVIMGADPETSAVNNYSQLWDMENLFVVGGSSFPHFGCYNPTGTIGALAYRAAEGMDKYLKDGGGLLVDAAKDVKMV